jgi:hypothetical protein
MKKNKNSEKTTIFHAKKQHRLHKGAIDCRCLKQEHVLIPVWENEVVFI